MEPNMVADGVRPMSYSVQQSQEPLGYFWWQLNFAGQINRVTSSGLFILKLVRKIFPFIPQELRKSVVVALLLSQLDYCNALLIGIDKAQRLKLQSIQNAAARLLLNIPRGHSTSAAIRSLHWLPIQQRAEFKALCLVHKALFGGVAADFRNFFSWYIPTRNLRSSDAGFICISKICKARWGGRSLSHFTDKLWNQLPISEINVE